MPRRLMIAVLLGLTSAMGCAAMEEGPISLVVQKPKVSGWPFKRTTPSAATRSGDRPETPRTTPARTAATDNTKTGKPSAARFLDSLPAELRERINAELADAGADERERLLAYMATVEPARIPALLESRRQQLRPVVAMKDPEVVRAAVLGTPTFELAADEPPGSGVHQAGAQSTVPTTVPTTVPAPMALQPRPTRNPLITLDPAGVEFDAPPQAAASTGEPSPAAGFNPLREASPSIPSTIDGPAGEAPPASTSPFSRLREWTTIRKPEAVEPAAAEQPNPGSALPTDASSLSLQSLSRRLRGSPTRPDGASSNEPAPLTAAEASYLQDGIQRLIALMDAETARLKPGTSFAEREQYVRRHAELRMLHLMAGNPALSQQAIPGADLETQEFWTSLMWSLSNYFDDESISDPSERAAAALDRLRAAEQHLQTTARIELRSLTFCDRIEGFGVYHPFERDVFRAGQPILLYSEVENFKTDVTAAGRYRTLLKSTVEITSSGEDHALVERRLFEATEDLSRSPRGDYFHSYKLDLPLHMLPGNYSLRLTVEDELSGKIGSSTIEFQIR